MLKSSTFSTRLIFLEIPICMAKATGVKKPRLNSSLFRHFTLSSTYSFSYPQLISITYLRLLVMGSIEISLVSLSNLLIRLTSLPEERALDTVGVLSSSLDLSVNFGGRLVSSDIKHLA